MCGARCSIWLPAAEGYAAHESAGSRPGRKRRNGAELTTFLLLLLFFIPTHSPSPGRTASPPQTAPCLGLEMRATFSLLLAISCCCRPGSATLSKSDARKPHRAEAEVSNSRALTWSQVRSDRSVADSRPVYLTGHCTPSTRVSSRRVIRAHWCCVFIQQGQRCENVASYA